MDEFNKISADFSVSPQILLDQIEQIKRAGFKSIICNRPDVEIDGPHYDAIAQAANALGLETIHLPMPGGQLSEVLIQKTKNALETLPKPVLAYCGSGTRCTILWCFANAQALGVDEVLKTAQKAGFEFEHFRPPLMQYAENP